MSECGGREKCVGVQGKENCECGGAWGEKCGGAGGRGGVGVGVQGEGEVWGVQGKENCECGGAGRGRGVSVVVRRREGEVCVVGQWRPKTAVKSEYGGVEGGRSVHGDGEVCVGGVHVCERKCMYCMSVDLYIHVRIPVSWVL